MTSETDLESIEKSFDVSSLPDFRLGKLQHLFMSFIVNNQNSDGYCKWILHYYFLHGLSVSRSSRGIFEGQ